MVVPFGCGLLSVLCRVWGVGLLSSFVNLYFSFRVWSDLVFGQLLGLWLCSFGLLAR